MVDAVTTDNELTATYIRRFNSNCTVIPDCPQVEWFDRRRNDITRAQQGTITLGWIGTPGTAYNLYVVWEALERLFDKHPDIHLRILGATPEFLPPFEKVRYSFVPRYTQAQMIDEALKMDIGLFPLQDVEACRVRGVLKATVYMSAGVVPVCSPVGQCVDLIKDGENGMLAGTAKDWEGKLALLIGDPALRKRLADNGLRDVRSKFTVDRSFALLKNVLER
jgi:glycosyltransferase involved in cell wall biosynthesis